MKTKIIFLAILAAITLNGFKSYRETLALKSIDSYESCVAAKGSRIQESYPATCVTSLGTRFTQPLTPISNGSELATITQSLGAKPPTWANAEVSGSYLANDLIQMCIDLPIKGSMDLCDYFEYWTNNRTGKWELLDSYSAGEEGPSTCKDWEEWKVARGMPCFRLSDGTSEGGDSQVNF